jgi:iron complex outermembrane receptor protein
MIVFCKNAAGRIYFMGTVACAVLMTLTPGTRLLAADADAGAGASADAGEAPILEEVTVHAQRRQENLQRVPITVDTVSGADAEARGTNSVQTLTSTIPNLTFTMAGNNTNTYIRGVGDTSASVNNEPSAAVYVDGVYNASAIALTALNFSNIEQIEVLKGPQGTLFGRNATAGVIQILTPDPKHELGGKVDVGWGSYNTTAADVYLTGGVTDKLAGDISVFYDNQNAGFGRDLTTGTPSGRRRDIDARTKWLFEPFETTKIRLTADYGRIAADGVTPQFVPGSTPPYPGRYNYFGFPSLERTQQWGSSLRIDQDVGSWLHAVSISSYRNVSGDSSIDSDLTAAPASVVLSHFNSHYTTQELQFSNQNPGRITWLVGGFYYGNFVAAAAPWINEGTKIAQGYRAFWGAQHTSSDSVFGQATAELFAGMRLTLGARYTDEMLRADTQTQNQAQNVIAGPFKSALRAHPVTWRVALEQQLTQDTLVYISANRGFKSGGYNLSSPGSVPFLPEHVNAYELGIKSEFLDHRVRLNLAGFWYDYTDLQVAVVLGGAQFFENAASARNYGLDGSFEFAATERLTFSAGLGLLDTKYRDYPGARGYTPTGGVINVPNAKGNELPFAPPVTGFLNVSYRIPTAVGDFKSSVNGSYNDRSYVAADDGFERPAYWMLNATFEWRPPTDKSWAVRLWGRNLTNAHYNLFSAESALGWYRLEGPPRMYGFTVEKDF